MGNLIYFLSAILSIPTMLVVSNIWARFYCENYKFDDKDVLFVYKLIFSVISLFVCMFLIMLQVQFNWSILRVLIYEVLANACVFTGWMLINFGISFTTYKIIPGGVSFLHAAKNFVGNLIKGCFSQSKREITLKISL